MLATIHFLYSDIFNQLLYCNSNFEEKIGTESITRDRNQQLEALSSDLFVDLTDVQIFTLKLDLLYHIAEHVSMFVYIYFLYASLYVHLSYTIITFIRKTPVRRVSTPEKAVAELNTSAADEDSSSIREGRKITAKDVQNKTFATLASIRS